MKKSEIKNKSKNIEFDFRLCVKFKGTHPKVMEERIKNAKIDANIKLSQFPLLFRPYYYRRKIKKIFGI
jgi:hypothetical protein